MLLDRGDPPDPLLDAAVDALVVMQRAAPPDGLPLWDARGDGADRDGHAVRLVVAGAVRRRGARRRRGTMSRPALADHAATGGRRPALLCASRLFRRQSAAACRTAGSAIIDFQGAAIGHPAYDLVSLLQDARRDIPPAVAAARAGTVSGGASGAGCAGFRAAFAACAAQRHLRVACQWVRLALRDGRPQYLAHGPRTWRLLEDGVVATGGRTACRRPGPLDPGRPARQPACPGLEP